MATLRPSRRLRYTEPLDWGWLLHFFATRAIPGVEAVVAGEYRRTVQLRAGRRLFRGWLRVTPARHAPALGIVVSDSLVPVLDDVVLRVRRQFDLDCEPAVVRAALGSLAGEWPGVRVPGAFDGFETVVRGILGQQITVAGASTLAGRLARELGTHAATPFDGLDRHFPTARTLAAGDPETIGRLGIVRTRVQAIQVVADACARRRITLAPGADVPATLKALLAIRGIGDWTAQYAAMRALKWADAFPAADFGILQALGTTRAREARARAETWRPRRAYAALCLWHRLGSGT